jgi:proteasome lid subunit RPN8/RPN11
MTRRGYRSAGVAGPARYRGAVLRIARSAHLAMVRHAVAGLPNEACGLLGGPAGTDLISAFAPTRNADASTKTYSIGQDGWDEADRIFVPLGIDVVGIMHSHTHTDPYPSPTDVESANPMLLGFHYVIVSLRDHEPMVRSWILDDATIVETPVAIVEG